MRYVGENPVWVASSCSAGHERAGGVDELVGGGEQRRVQLRALEVQPGAGARALLQRGDDAERAEEAVVVVLVAHHAGHRRVAGAAALVEQTAEARQQRGEALEVGLRAPRAPPGQVAVDEVGVDRPQLLGPEPEALGLARPEVVHDDVGPPASSSAIRWPSGDLRSMHRLRLPRCEASNGSGSGRIGSPPSGSILMTSAPRSERIFGAVRGGEEAGEVDDGDALERCAERRRRAAPVAAPADGAPRRPARRSGRRRRRAPAPAGAATGSTPLKRIGGPTWRSGPRSGSSTSTQQPGELDLVVEQRLAGPVHGDGGDVGGVEQLDPLVARAGPQRGGHPADELELVVGERHAHLGLADDGGDAVAQAEEVHHPLEPALAAGVQHQVLAVGGRRTGRAGCGCGRTPPASRTGRGTTCPGLVPPPVHRALGEHAVEQRDVDALAQPGDAAGADGGQRADRGRAGRCRRARSDGRGTSVPGGGRAARPSSPSGPRRAPRSAGRSTCGPSMPYPLSRQCTSARELGRQRLVVETGPVGVGPVGRRDQDVGRPAAVGAVARPRPASTGRGGCSTCRGPTPCGLSPSQAGSSRRPAARA